MAYSYDEQQYESFSYSLTFPEHLETIGTLFGLNPTSYKKARILELGCASGGNIIPLASLLPEAEVVGIDLSSQQIEQGQHLIEELGLSNILLKHQSILDFEADKPFDYIICHGVYSWVDNSIREKILQICQQHMSPNGLACISYNTLPCWNMVLSVRDMMQFHVRNFTSPKEKIDQSRVLLNFLVNGLAKDNTPYANFLRNEIKIVANAQDYYIFHEYLEDVNQPLYFHEFIKQSNQFKLNYLADSHLASMYPGNLKKSFVEKLNEIKDVVKVGQYMDFIRNQRFRTTLLCHDNQVVNRQLKTDDVEKFCISYSGKFQQTIPLAKVKSSETLTFEAPGILVTLTKPLLKACLKVLHDQFGKPVAYASLVKQAMKMVGEKDAAKAKLALNNELNLIRLVLGGILKLHVDEGAYTGVISTLPETTPLIRKLSQKQHRVPNLRHESLNLLPVERIVLQYLDGQHKHSDIFKDLEKKIALNEIQLSDEKGKPVTEVKDIKKRVPKIALNALESLVKKAYLVA